jgi:hypothetical protein
LKLDNFLKVVKSKAIVSKNTILELGWDISTKIKSLNFESVIKLNSDQSLTIKKVFKWNSVWFDMSDVVLDQIKFAWKDPNKLNNILLDDVVYDDILNLLKNNQQKYVIDNWWKIGWLDWMTRKILEKTWKTLKEIKIYKDKDVYYPGEYNYDIQLILK